MLPLPVSSVVVGMWGGIIISIIAPIIAFMQQHIAFVWMVPIVAAGNLVLVVILYGGFYQKNKWTAIGLIGLCKSGGTLPVGKGRDRYCDDARAGGENDEPYVQLAPVCDGCEQEGLLASIVLRILTDTNKI
jgi:hypothetical protein